VGRSALRVEPDGALSGRVHSVRTAAEQSRLVVELPVAGRLDAVAGLDVALRPGDSVRLGVDPDRVARVADRPAGSGDEA